MKTPTNGKFFYFLCFYFLFLFYSFKKKEETL